MATEARKASGRVASAKLRHATKAKIDRIMEMLEELLELMRNYKG